jgi:hypothetical protein
MNGSGTLTNTDGSKIIYAGDFMNGKFHGQGELVEDNMLYKGGFKNGLKHGLANITNIHKDNTISFAIAQFDNGVLIDIKFK